MFGTDGIRGRANRGHLTPESMLKVGRALGRWQHEAGLPPRVVIGRDPRRSGDLLHTALSAGLLAEGSDVLDLGLLPTPGVMYLVEELEAGLGVMLSASHNPAPDNGIKVFTAGGNKLCDNEQARVEELCAVLPGPGVEATGLGRVEDVSGERRRYLDALCERHAGLDLGGRTLWVDCAHGATCVTAPEVLERLGATVERFAAEPRPDAINDGCGATVPQALAAKTRPGQIGLCFDGDGDRLMLIDERGQVRDGDDVLFAIATSRHRAGRFEPPRVVGTVMTNFGLQQGLAARGIGLDRVGVGDRAIAARLKEEDLELGGEPSGHVIFRSFMPAGDGLWTALEVLTALADEGTTLAELCAGWERSPQVLINVPVHDRPRFASVPALVAVRAEVEARLAGRGRLVLRYSGTEPLCRVMVEAEEAGLARETAERVAGCVREHL